MYTIIIFLSILLKTNFKLHFAQLLLVKKKKSYYYLTNNYYNTNVFGHYDDARVVFEEAWIYDQEASSYQYV